MQYTLIFCHYFFYGAAWVALFSIASEAWRGDKDAVGSFYASLVVATLFVFVVHAVCYFVFHLPSLEYRFDLEIKLTECAAWVLGAVGIMKVRLIDLPSGWNYRIKPKQSKKKNA